MNNTPHHLKTHTRIVCKDHPEWGAWTITKSPSPREDWYHIRGESGERVLFMNELKRFWEVAT